MLVNYNDNETLYTLKEAEMILKRKQEINKRVILYYLKQKLSGLLLFAIGIICPIIMDGDGTVSLLFIPLGLYLAFTKEHVMEFEGK